MLRREFIKSGFTIGGGILISSPMQTFCNDPLQNNRSRVIISQDSQLHEYSKRINSDRLQKILDNGIQALFDKDSPGEAWAQIVKPDEIIGLKVNCLSGKGATHTDLVEAICERLQEVGIRANVIQDRVCVVFEFVVFSDGPVYVTLGGNIGSNLVSRGEPSVLKGFYVTGVGHCYMEVSAVFAYRNQLMLYGPFNYNNRYTSESNERFDGWLKARDPDSGIRNFEDINTLAEQVGLVLVRDYEMPANNRILCWKKSPTP